MKAERYWMYIRKTNFPAFIDSKCREFVQSPIERMWCVQLGVRMCYRLMDHAIDRAYALDVCIDELRKVIEWMRTRIAHAPPYYKIRVPYHVYILLASAEISWGITVVIVGRTYTFRFVAEAPGMSITVVITKPDGTKITKTAQDLGDGNYAVDVYVDQEGMWLLEAVFPDGFRMKKQFFAVAAQQT